MEENIPKKIYKDGGASGAVVLFFIFLFIFSKWGPAIPFSVLSQSKGEPMVVTGEGKATAIPDVANISFGIENSGRSLKQAQNEVNQKSQDLVSALKKLGIDEKDIKTSSYNIYPESDYNQKPPIVNGYRVSINYLAKIRDVEKVNDVLTTVTGSGANVVGKISFDLSDEARTKATQEARQDAVSKAKESAQSLASASGVSLGKIINVSEPSNDFNPRPLYSMDAKAGLGAGNQIAPDIQPGTTEVDIIVSLSYEVR